MKKEVLIIIPAYNEEKNLEALLDKLEAPEIAEIADVLLVNDASIDTTKQIALRRKATMVTHIFNLGYGSALQLGYKFALRREYQYVIQMDADGQHDICNIKNLYNELKTPDENGEYPDIVLGSRFVEGSQSFKVSFVKKIAFTLFRTMIKLGTGKKIKDPTTGLQGLSKRAIFFYSRYAHFDDRYPDANMIMNMLLLGYNVREVASVMHSRTEGESMHSGLKPFIYMFRMTFSIIAVWIRVKWYKIDVGYKDHEIYY